MASLRVPYLAVSLVAVALLAPSALGGYEDDAIGGTQAGPGSVSTRFISAGGSLVIELAATGDGATGAGLLLAGPTDSIMITVARVPNHDGLLIQYRGLAVIQVDTTASVNAQGGFGERFTFTNVPAGEYDLIVFGAGAVSIWSWSVLGARSSAAQSTGDRAWLATSREFTGEKNVQFFESGAGVRATDGRFAFQVKSSLVGLYYPVHATSVHDSMSATTPSGPRACTCAWMGTGVQGNYVLHESGVGAGSSMLAEVIFIGADASFA